MQDFRVSNELIDCLSVGAYVFAKCRWQHMAVAQGCA